MEKLINGCEKCNSSNIEYKTNEFQKGYYCNDCDHIFTHQIDYGSCCGWTDVQTMKIATANGFSYRNICQNCYTLISVLKKTDKPISSYYEITLDELRKKTNSINRHSLYTELMNVKTEKQKNKDTAFWNNYKEYLNSQKWYNKRNKVLERDKYLCQACLKNKAIQVHHLTYERVFDEPLFDLVSICLPCHEKLHKK
jgi:hypothetical protein